jgi:hypothetical protein
LGKDARANHVPGGVIGEFSHGVAWRPFGEQLAYPRPTASRDYRFREQLPK